MDSSEDRISDFSSRINNSTTSSKKSFSIDCLLGNKEESNQHSGIFAQNFIQSIHNPQLLSKEVLAAENSPQQVKEMFFLYPNL